MKDVAIYIVGLSMLSCRIASPLLALRGLRYYSADSLKVFSENDQFVCYHPPTETLYAASKPLRPQQENRNKSLTAEQQQLVRKLRREDPRLWTVKTLATQFDVTNEVIRETVSATLEHQQYLDQEREKVRKMKSHLRNEYLRRSEEERQRRLAVEIEKYKTHFPLHQTNADK